MIAFESELGQCACFTELESANRELHCRHQCRGSAELVNAKAKKQWDQDGISRHFAADAHPDAIVVGCVHGRLDEFQDGRMRWLIEVSNFWVHSVHSQRVLNEVVCADAEKPGVFREGIGNHDCGWYFDHDPDFHIRVEWDALGSQFFHAFCDHRVGLKQFVEA